MQNVFNYILIVIYIALISIILYTYINLKMAHNKINKKDYNEGIDEKEYKSVMGILRLLFLGCILTVLITILKLI